MVIRMCHVGIKADAVNIYSTYISIDCHTDIGISDELRNLAICEYCIYFCWHPNGDEARFHHHDE